MADRNKIGLLLFLMVIVLTNCAEVEFRNCIRGTNKDREITVHKVILEPCEKTPCPLVKGRTTTLKLEITPNITEDTLIDSAQGKVAGLMWHRFRLPHRDNCVRTGICPLQAGEKYNYVYSLPISNYFPRIRVLIKWKLLRKDGSEALCIMLRSKITNGY